MHTPAKIGMLMIFAIVMSAVIFTWLEFRTAYHQHSSPQNRPCDTIQEMCIQGRTYHA